MQVRKFPAFAKPAFVSGAFIITQKMAGNGIDDHHLAAAFHVGRFECFRCHLKMTGHTLCIRLGNIDHQLPAAGAA